MCGTLYLKFLKRTYSQGTVGVVRWLQYERVHFSRPAGARKDVFHRLRIECTSQNAVSVARTWTVKSVKFRRRNVCKNQPLDDSMAKDSGGGSGEEERRSRARKVSCTSVWVCRCNSQEVYIWEEFPQTAKCGGECSLLSNSWWPVETAASKRSLFYGK